METSKPVEQNSNNNAASPMEQNASPTTSNPTNTTSKESLPTVCIVIGMAGSGKTTLMQRINSYLHTKKTPPYVINLDPAVKKIPYSPNINIQDTVNYKEVMKQYNLGPNGGILTSLNLFATKFDQVLGLLEKRASQVKYMLLDTPGQIEIFTWSASGQIITESLASTFPTVVIYVVDTPRSQNPTTFMSNMLYACSILYKTQLPFIIAFNKTDVSSHEFAIKWMKDFDKLDLTLQAQESYMSSLTRSMGLVMSEFYENLRCVGVSAVSGQGMDDLFVKIEEAAKEYWTVYKPDLDERIQKKKQAEEKRKTAELEKVKKDLEASKGKAPVKTAPKTTKFVEMDENDEDEDEYGEMDD